MRRISVLLAAAALLLGSAGCDSALLPMGVEKCEIVLDLHASYGGESRESVQILLYDNRTLLLNYYRDHSYGVELGRKEYARFLAVLRENRFAEAVNHGPGVLGAQGYPPYLHMQVHPSRSRHYSMVTDSTALPTEIRKGLSEIDSMVAAAFGSAYRWKLPQALP